MKRQLEQKYTSTGATGDRVQPKWAEPHKNTQKISVKLKSKAVTGETDSLGPPPVTESERFDDCESETADDYPEMLRGFGSRFSQAVFSTTNPGVTHPIPASRFWRFPFEMPFGKYNGQTVEAVREADPDYLKWCLDNDGQQYRDSEGSTRTFHLGSELRHEIEKGFIITVRDEDMPLRCVWNEVDGCYEIERP